MPKILLVDDDELNLWFMEELFANQEYVVKTAATGDEASALLQTNQFDVIVLDWELPDKSGIEILSEFRSGGGLTPTLMLTGRTKLTDKETGFEAGADDYLTRPFQPEELQMRVKALLRRSAISAKAAPANKSTTDEEFAEGAILLDRYIVSEEIGKGYAGVVYKGKHKILGRPVAIKMVHSHLTGEAKSITRFCMEAKAISSLSHPNIVTLYDFGTTESGVPFFVMDFLAGNSLEECIRSVDHFEQDRAINIIGQLCNALSYMHNKGLLHRDIKPGNIIIVKNEVGKEVPKLVDFGLVKTLTQIQELKLTQEGEAFGTPLYMSPEQCSGVELDCRSDIYSSGCLFYEMLTGRVPFTGQSALQTMYMRMTEEIQSFSQIRPDLSIPSELEGIIRKALAKDREDRFATMDEMKSALEQFSNQAGKKTS